MKKFLLKIILFFLGVVVIDRVYGNMMELLWQRTQGGFVTKTRYVCDSVDADILILGSSRARMQYDPKIISDTLGMSCYNCGHNGMGIITNYTKMKILTKRYMPKLVIVDILPILDVMTRDDNIIFVNELRPWYDVEGVDSVFWNIDSLERYKMLSKMYQYHSVFFSYIENIRGSIPKGGYDPAPADKIIEQHELKQHEPTDNVVDPLKFQYLEKFITEYKDRSKIIFVVSPRYNFKTSHTVDPIRRLCKKYNILLLDHYADQRFVNVRSDFGDGNHMNEEGATKFSKFIAQEIKKYIQ